MSFTTLLALISLFNFHHFLTAENIEAPKTLETYIVHVDEAIINDLDSFLQTTLATSAVDPQPRILHRYRHVFSGFAARLSADEVKAMEETDGVISARREEVYKLHTTHSPQFMGLKKDEGLWKASNYGKGVIIGVLDTGITPGHPSFSGGGVPPPPAKWKGKCEFQTGGCNNKLIGARNFVGRGSGSSGTPADEVGHGTHTAGTAGGNFVLGASIYGNANGTAVGIAPLAHIAIYKVCAPEGCPESSIMAGMEAAVGDGVDVLSISLGGPSYPYYNNTIALGAYRAVEKGIFVSCSAGNEGPSYWTTANEAPWILTVGASTLDRSLRATVVLGNGENLDGESAFQPTRFSSKDFKLVLPNNKYAFCGKGSLKKVDVAGKIVLCDNGGLVRRIGKGEAVSNSSGAGMILMNQESQGYTLSAEVHVLPTSQVSYADAVKIKSYVARASNPTAKIVFKGTRIGDKRAPVVASFSSRGPSATSPGILKPDIIGPGNNILAAWPNSVENHRRGRRRAHKKFNFNMISGTSMSAPHLSGVAALLKSAHPEWSPAAIKSAIMTTADQVNAAGRQIKDQRLVNADVFATGAGHVSPSRATDPGLVYDIRPDDYIPYLCGLKYTNKEVSIIVQRKIDCSKESPIPEGQLNYPSFSIRLGSSPQTYTRTVTNVGESNSSYRVEIVSPDKVSVKVKPKELRFSKVGEKLSYRVTFTRSGRAAKYDSTQGFVKWISAKHLVTSPIAIVFE